MLIKLPEFCLVALVGASGSGKSSFALAHFGPWEVLSSDFFRGLVSGDPQNQAASEDAFECMYEVAAKRLKRRKLTVLDATHLDERARAKAMALAREHHCPLIFIALATGEVECQKRNRGRGSAKTPEGTVSRQAAQLPLALARIREEKGGLYVVPENETAVIERIPLSCDRRDLPGPFDIIGDVHGCYAELCALLAKMGYRVDEAGWAAEAPPGRMAVFVGDLGDRGPASLACMRLAMGMCEKGQALWLAGNHDARFARKLAGKNVTLSQGLETTLCECKTATQDFLETLARFLGDLPDHLLLAGGRLLVAHAGLKEELQGRQSEVVRAFCLYGDVDGTKDELGLPVRKDWAAAYSGEAFVVYGHTPKAAPRFLNNTACIDTGCVFGGHLTALRYPEMEIVQEKARKTYRQPPRPLS